MIISASYRTDIPAFYSGWFRARRRAGFADVVNPYGGQRYTVDLRPQAVAGYVFWTRNLRPFADVLAEVAADRTPFVVHYTVTGYPRLFDRSTVPPDQAIADLTALRERYGARAAVWRYDPILLSSATPPAWHRETVAHLARAVSGTVDEMTTSFMEPYRKTRRNLDAVAAASGVAWWDPGLEEKVDLITDLAALTRAAGITLTLCTQPALVEATGLPAARCIDTTRLSAVAGRPVVARQKGNRPGCLCAESRDIGDYDTCPHGCVYCYAVRRRALARVRYRRHDPAAPLLINDRR